MNPIRTISIRTTLFAGFLAIAGIAAAQGQHAVEISTGWLMQDVRHVTQSGEAISKVGFAPRIYAVKPYSPPKTASANLPTPTKVPDEVRYHNAPRVEVRGSSLRVTPIEADARGSDVIHTLIVD